MTTTHESATGPRVRTSRIDASVVVIAIVLLPLLATFVSLVGTHWHPASDNALEVLRIRDVGGRHTPLVGVQSRFGWDHPGPALFWLLAPFRWVAGDTAVLVGVLCINGAAITGALLLARRRGGLAATSIVAVALLLLMRAFEPRLLMDVWNPWVALFPFFAYLMCCWSVADADLPALPWLVGIGSFVVQTHVGYAPLVAGAALVAGVTLAVVVRRRARRLEHVRRWSVITAIVAVAMWFPPVVQQFTGHPGNLTEILDAFRHPKEEVLGLAGSLGIMGGELGRRAPWITGDDETIVGFVRTGAVLPALLLLAIALGLGIAAARRRRDPAPLSLAILALGATASGVFAGARIMGFPGGYLLRWWWVVAAVLWCSIAFSLWQLVATRIDHRLGFGVAAVAIVVLASIVVTDAVPARVPEASHSTAIGRLAASTAGHLDRDQQYFVHFMGQRDFGAVGVGVWFALVDRGFDVKVAESREHGYGSWRTGRPEDADAVITVVTSDEIDDGWTPPPNSTLVAAYDSLDPAARARTRELEEAIRDRIPPGRDLRSTSVDFALAWPELRAIGVDQPTIDELRALRTRGVAYEVWLTPR